MRVDVYGGMAKDRLILSFVQFCVLDPVSGQLNPVEDRYAIHGGGVGTLKQIKQWANDCGYKIRLMHED